MDKAQSKNSTVSWIVIDFIFVAVIVFLLFSFLYSNEKKAVNQAQERIGTYVDSWTTQLSTGADRAGSFGKAIKEYYELRGDSAKLEEIVAYAQTVVDNSDVTHILLCEGNKVYSDENGNKYPDFDLTFCQKSAETEYFFVNDTAFDDGDYLCVYVPLGSDKYVLIFTSTDAIAESFAKSDFDVNSFLAIVDLKGQVICSFNKYKDLDSIFLSEESLLEAIDKSAIYKNENNDFKAKLRRGSIAVVRADYSGDKRTIAAKNISVGTSNWSLVYGVRQQNVDRLVEANVQDSKATVLKFAIIMVVFSVFVVVSVIVSSVRNKEHGRELEDKADTDLLTDLYNKTATERKIQEYLEANPNSRGLMFILDIDNFKKINDTMGHAFGDTLLKTLGKEIKAEFRVSDIIGRTGGDEFMVFLKNVNDDVIVEREANRITKFFHDFKAGGDYVKYSATASIGAAIFPDDAKNFKELYVAADQALYKAKKRGKNQLVFYNEEAHKE